MEPRFVVMIWHQAGGSNNNEVYYLWEKEPDETWVFPSARAAREKWQELGMNRVHAGVVMEVTPQVNNWI